jgi:septal ring-binding cell division protein DamX
MICATLTDAVLHVAGLSLVLVSPRDVGTMDVTPLLMNCMSPDQNTRAAAEQQIEQAKVNNLVRTPATCPPRAPT